MASYSLTGIVKFVRKLSCEFGVIELPSKQEPVVASHRPARAPGHVAAVDFFTVTDGSPGGGRLGKGSVVSLPREDLRAS